MMVIVRFWRVTFSHSPIVHFFGDTPICASHCQLLCGALSSFFVERGWRIVKRGGEEEEEEEEEEERKGEEEEEEEEKKRRGITYLSLLFILFPCFFVVHM